MEDYFVATFNEGYLEAVYWVETEKEAKKYAASLKKKWPEDSKNVIVGKLLVKPEE